VWIQLTQVRVQRRALVKTTMNFRVSQEAVHIGQHNDLSEKTLLHRVSELCYFSQELIVTYSIVTDPMKVNLAALLSK
jgi:hypothetical protein